MRKGVTPMVEAPDASSPVLWPPIIFGAAALVSAILAWFVPLPFPTAFHTAIAMIAGVLLIAVGVGLLVIADRLFTRVGTAVKPTQPTSAIVTTGIYSYTRNPMYLGMSLILLGLCLATGSLWFLIALPIAMFAVTKLAIEREEAYLERKFGADYLAYKARVRRWMWRWTAAPPPP
jgi:protein-S-isoprenylcysteine O-methyltransferase Ste14